MLLSKSIQITVFAIDNTQFEAIGDLGQFTSLIWPDAFNGYAFFDQLSICICDQKRKCVMDWW